MRRIHTLSAHQMAGLSVLGSVLLSGAFLLMIPFRARFEVAGWPPRFGFIFIPLLGGTALNFIADGRLRRGIKEDRWSAGEIASLQRLVGSPFAQAASWSFFLLGLGGMLLFSHRYRAVGWAVIILSQCLPRLQTAVLPRMSSDRSELKVFDWQALPRLRSEHWGER